jgi:esterase/lipase superfamily enzyme
MPFYRFFQSFENLEIKLLKLAKLLQENEINARSKDPSVGLRPLLEAGEECAIILDELLRLFASEEILPKKLSSSQLSINVKEMSNFVGLLNDAVRVFLDQTAEKRTDETLLATISIGRTYVPNKIRGFSSSIKRIERSMMGVGVNIEAKRKVSAPPILERMLTDPLLQTVDVGKAWRNVPVFFATDRKLSKDRKLPRAKFENDRGSGKLTYGVAEVSIPPGHRLGHMERPTLWKLQFVENSNRDIVIRTCDRKELGQWKEIAAERLKDTKSRSALVFVHGYNVSFDDAVRRTAQIGYDLQFEGLITTYSWSSEASILAYPADEKNVKLTMPLFRRFLLMLRTDLNLDAVHIIAHSMGNRAVVSALESMTLTSGKLGAEEVVMAAPDIDANVFKLALAKLHSKARRYTLYGSDTDRAMALSKSIHSGYSRAGDGGKNIFVATGIDTVDASAVGKDMFGFGHSYFADKKTVLSDIHYVVNGPLPPIKRFGLKPAEKDGLGYWLFQP